MAKLRTKSSLSYFGSESEVAASLAEILNPCKHVTILCVGGAAIIPHLSARGIVANDLNDDAINYYRCVSGVYGSEKQEKLINRADMTLSHPAELTEAIAILDDPSTKGTWLRAWAYWAQCWVGRKGKGGTDDPASLPSVRRKATGGNNASRIESAAADMLLWADHFKRCEWECVDFRVLLEKVADDHTCGVYVDPPWIGVGDVYLHKFSEKDHKDLAAGLKRFQHTLCLVRYGDHPLVRELYAGWRVIPARSRDQQNTVKDEIWLVNK